MAAVAALDMISFATKATGVDSLDPANAFVTPDELLVVLSAEIAELYDEILLHGFGDFFRSEKTVTLTANKDRYDLAVDFGISDFYEVIGVDILWSSTVVRSAKLFMEAERNRFRRVLPTWSQFCDIWYRPIGSQIQFMPVPQTGVSVTLIYIPQFAGFTETSDQFESYNQWHMMAVYGLCAYIARKDDDEPKAMQYEGLKEKQRARVADMAARRIEGEPPRVQRSRRFDDEDIW